jgi:hypothetical protein
MGDLIPWGRKSSGHLGRAGVWGAISLRLRPRARKRTISMSRAPSCSKGQSDSLTRTSRTPDDSARRSEFTRSPICTLTANICAFS